MNVNSYMNGYHTIPLDMDKPIKPKKRPKCSHKFELLEYPTAAHDHYSFYCVYCLEIQQKKPPGRE